MIFTDGTHLIADTLTELHEFAQSLGLKREWFQPKSYPHYDLFRGKPKLALKGGAELLSPLRLGWKIIELKKR